MKKIFFLLTILSLEVNSFANDQPYVPPIGIPVPSFGINETYRMYDYEPNQNPALTYQESSDGGYFTHYVDSTDPNTTNTNNAYGSIKKPRTSVPRNLPAGSIVEVHNNVGDGGWGYLNISGIGTEQYPIFVRGVNTPHVTRSAMLGNGDESHYIIVEDFKFRRGYLKDANPTYTYTESSHLCFRNCEFDGEGTNGQMTGIVTWGTGNTLNNVVLYNNTIHSSGQWDPYLATADSDYHGVGVNGYVSYLWILDNTFYHLEGDGVQINGNDVNDMHHVYIGGNTAYSNKQTGFWTKTAGDVIFSQNTVHGMRHSSSADGAGIGCQYDCKRVWFLFNTVYDCKHGIQMVSQDQGGREEIYMIGNLIYGSTVDGDGIALHNQNSGIKVLLNTIYDCPVGINHGWYKFSASIFNNIIAQCSTAIDLLDAQNSASTSGMDYNLLDGTGNIIWDKTYSDLAAFQAGTDHGDNCIEASPLFVDAAKGNFNLQELSPVKDLQTSEQVQVVFNRFLQLYGIELAADIDGIPRTVPTIVLPEPEDTSGSDEDVDTDTGDSDDDVNTEIPETPGVPAEDTGSSNTEESVVSPVVSPIISPLPIPGDTAATETNSSSNNSANYSTISPLFSSSNSDLHMDSSRNTKARTIKVRRIFDRFDDLYRTANRNPKSSESYE